MDTPAVQPPPPPVVQPVPPQPRPKNNSGILVGIFLLFLGIAVGMMIDKTTFLSTIRIPYLGATPTPTPIPSPTEALEQVDTANWKTYINNKNLYAVKIPPGWDPSRGNPAGGYTDEELQELDRMYWSKNNSSFSVEVLNPCTNLENCFKEFQTAADASALTFGARHTTMGFETTKGTFQGMPNIESRSTFGESVNAVKGIFFVYKDKLWLLETQSLPSFKEADQILSTFKFVDSSQISPTPTQGNICGGWDTSGEILCTCTGRLIKPTCPSNAVCDGSDYTCTGQCGTCCYKGIAENPKYPKCQ